VLDLDRLVALCCQPRGCQRTLWNGATDRAGYQPKRAGEKKGPNEERQSEKPSFETPAQRKQHGLNAEGLGPPQFYRARHLYDGGERASQHRSPDGVLLSSNRAVCVRSAKLDCFGLAA